MKTYIVSVKDESLDLFSKIVEIAQKIGMKITYRHARFGVFCGDADLDEIEKVKGIDGVLHVEENREVQASYNQ